MLKLPSLSITAFALASQLFSVSAAAHIWLDEPISRYPSEVAGENKACPCGVGDSNRTCSNPNDRSDPNRSTDRVTVLQPGQKLKIVIDEYVGHAGRYRVAFDEDGADLEDFNQHILLDEPDTPGRQGNVSEGSSIWEFEIEIPNIPCSNCTLQVIQMMDGNMVDLVPDPVGRSSYYQCADIVIEGASGGTSGNGNAADAGPETIVLFDDTDDSGMCSLLPVGARGSSGYAALSLLVLVGLVRRRRATSGR